MLVEQLADRRRQSTVASACRLGRGYLPGRLLESLLGPHGGRSGGCAGLIDRAEQRADLDFTALLDHDLGKRAARRGIELERHLVGLELDDRLVRVDRVAHLLEPSGHGRLGDRLAKAWHPNFDAHPASPIRSQAVPTTSATAPVSALSTNWLCSRTCC